MSISSLSSSPDTSGCSFYRAEGDFVPELTDLIWDDHYYDEESCLDFPSEFNFRPINTTPELDLEAGMFFGSLESNGSWNRKRSCEDYSLDSCQSVNIKDKSSWIIPPLKKTRLFSVDRTVVVKQFIECFNSLDAQVLGNYINQHLGDSVTCICPDAHDPVIGKRDFIVLTTLFMESHPDGSWYVLKAEEDRENSRVACIFRFYGCKLYTS